VSWVWTHGSYLDHEFNLNGHPSTLVWEMQNNEDTPNGATVGSPLYANTATGPYDQTTWGPINFDDKVGWSNDNQVQVNYQRLFHHGIGFQAFWVYSKAFRMGGNSSRDGVVYPWESYLGTQQNANVTMTSPYPFVTPALPPNPPQGVQPWWEWHQLDVFEQYKRDSSISPQHIAFNYIVDLPLGRGKKFFGNANRLVNELIGGYQLAGKGHASSSIFQPATGNWGPTNPIQTYKHKLPITDCTSGNCYREYMWFNGYVEPTQNASSGFCNAANGVGNTSDGVPKCIYGLPSSYTSTSYQTPIDVTPGTPYYNENYVTVTGSGLNSGAGGSENQVDQSGANETGAGPFSKTFIQGPKNWESDISLFKKFPITERVTMNFKMDVFNFLNHQGYTTPNTTTGIQYFQAGGVSNAQSYNPARQLQFTLRLSF
jgi:hypothetical protein